MNKSIFYFKRLTATEVGNRGTHEIYIRMPNDFNSEEFFQEQLDDNNGVLEKRFKAKNLTYGHESEELIDLRYVYFVQSNQEKRIPSLGKLFMDNNVHENDVVRLESRIENGIPSFYITFFRPYEIQMSPNSFYYSIKNNNPYHNNNPDNQDSCKKQSRQVIYYGAPGTGKSHKIKEILAEQNVQKENIFRTTFHPDSDYSTFVGAYKPTRGKKPLYGLNGSTTVRMQEGGNPLNEETITYNFIPQAFLNAYIRSYQTTDNVYLIIEEINRGNCAQIFGDLFQLLDRDEEGKSEYTIKADTDLKAYLEETLGTDNEGIKDGEICLPSNLYIYATMNTSDQSLFPIDSAFKRRWDWEYEPIKYKNTDWVIAINGEKFSWVSFQRIVNSRILASTNSEDKMLGDYFVNPHNKIITDTLFLNKVLFYLWNDVCKDDNGEIFKTSKEKEVSFSELYGDEGKQTLIKMMEYLGVEKVANINNTDPETQEDDNQ